ncbi:MAG TPA: hypothetical protein V6C69_08335 [Trichormus sp.]
MKLRRRKGATLGLVAVSVLVIIMIGVGCFFLAKICGGSREVTNATDAGTLNVARAALRSRDAEVAVPPAGYPTDPASFATLADPVYGGMTLYTYNRAVAEALLVALNAQQEGTPTSASNATTVYNELTALGQSLTTALKAQATLQARFNQVASGGAGQNPGNNSKMFGNNAISEIAYSSQWMKTGGSTNIWFYQNPNPIVPGQPAPPSTVPPTANLASLNLTSAGTVNFTPSGGGATNAYNNKYMVGYSPINVVGFGTYIGVPVFPQQNPHLVSTADFKSSPTNYAPPAGNTSVPPNAFSVQAQSLDTNSGTGMVASQNAMGGSLACAIVGCTIGGVNNVTSPVHFAASLPGGYVLISNRSAATPPNGFNNPTIFDDSNSIFNHELNAQGNEGDIMSVGNSAGGQYVFYDDNSSTAPAGNGGQVVSQWSSYNNSANSSTGAADPPAPATWTWNGTTMTGPPAIPPNIFVMDGSGNAYASTGSAQLGGDGGGQATIDQTQVTNALKNMGTSPGSEDCMTQMNNSPYYPVDAKCGGNSLNSLSTAFNRLGTGPSVGGNPNPQMWSNVDNVKAQVINAFHSRTIPLTIGPYSAGGLGGVGASPAASGLGCYKANITDPQLASAPTQANPQSRWSSGLESPLEYTTVGQTSAPDPVGGTDPAVGTTVYAYLNQISGCALSGVINDLTQRCCEIQPNTTSAQVIALLQRPVALYMNTNLYICKTNPSDPTSGLTITSTAPNSASTYFASPNTPPTPDGNNVAGTSSDCKSPQYGLSGGSGQGGLVDSQSLNGVSGGDNNLHDQPFMNQSGSIDAQDHADFILSSGYQNELGKLDFYQTIQTSPGGDQFSRPN